METVWLFVSDLKRPFKLEGMSRVDDTAVHKAVREAFVNLIIHSDYMITGVLKIVKKNDGFLFSNPGSLKLPLQVIYEGGNSKARNPRIQTMLRMIGLGDNVGSGFPTILSAWKEENWRKPDLNDNIDLQQVDLRLWMVSLMPAECTEFLYRLFGDAYARLRSEEQIILATAYLEGEVSNSRMQSVLDLHAVDVGKYLYHLVEKDMLRRISKGRWTTYYLNEKYQFQPEQMELKDLENADLKLNATDRLIYEYISENGFITKDQVMAITKVGSPSGASAALNRLMKQNLIKKKRQGRHFYYEKS